MEPFDFSIAKERANGIYLNSSDGVFLEIFGSQERIEQGKRFAAEYTQALPKALDMIQHYLREVETYSLDSIAFYEERTGDNGDFLLSFSRDEEPSSESTYYDVIFFMNETCFPGIPKYHPFKLSIRYG